MIYTLTFNPALDYITEVSNFKEGQVNRTSSENILPGGKGINVSIVLSNLNVENTALGFAGGFTGKELESLLREKNIITDFIYVKGGNTRINIKLKTGTETEINATGPVITQTELNQLYKKLEKLHSGDFLVLAGSVPRTLPDTVYSEIAQRISKNKINLIVDAEKKLLENVLKFKPFLIKPNHHELGAILDAALNNKEDIVSAALKLQDMGAKNVFVSMAGDGGIFVSEKRDIFFSPAPVGKVINSTGAGDSLVAGFLSEYIYSKDYKKAFLMGLCSGSASAFSHDLATKDEIEKLYSSLSGNQIQIINV